MQFFIVAACHSDCRGARTSRPWMAKHSTKSPRPASSRSHGIIPCLNRFLETDRPQAKTASGHHPQDRGRILGEKNAPRLARNHLGVTDVSSVAATTLALPDAEARSRSTARSARARPLISVSHPAAKKRERLIWYLRTPLGRQRLPSYSASGVGFSVGGSIANVLAVRHVIEKLPVNATNATKLSSPMVFSAAA